MESDFSAAYQALNSAQRQAVDTIDGPVLVVAGPGTGKTQLLSLRVANILKQTDTSAENILCLTFTNFAVTNMRDRLSRLVGASAQRVQVRTFHSFAADIMSYYPQYFWNGARLSIAPGATQLEIIQNILGALPLDNPLASRFAGNLTAINDVQQSLKLAKEAGLTPQKLQAMLSVNSAYIEVIEPLLVDILSSTLSAKKLPAIEQAVLALPDQPLSASVAPLQSLSTVLKESLLAAVALDSGTSKATNTSAWKKRWLQSEQGRKGMFDERRRGAWWLSLVDVYEQYRQQLHTQGYYDYADMIIEVITQLEQQPELLASVQERFQYVLIDEFQDTNAAQLRLAHLVATHYSAADRPNLMAVGDDDQSIYAFNGAELNNMLSFRQNYPATKIIVLQQNYRSTPDLLTVSQQIIEQASDRLVLREPGLTKHLQAAGELAHVQGTIEHLSYATRDHQLLLLAERIKADWLSNNTGTLAVLARGHDSLRRLSAELLKLDVPISYEQQNNILDGEFVQQISLLAELVSAIAAGDKAVVNHHLAELLRYPAWGVKPTVLWQLAVANFRTADWMDSLLEHDNQQLNSLASWLLALGQQTHQPLPLLVEYLVGLRPCGDWTSPLRAYYLGQTIDSTYLEGLSAIRLLVLLSQEFNAETPGSLSDFVRFIALNKELGRSIADLSWFRSGERAVELMTVHKAKGLEFDSVYVIDAVEDFWQPRRGGRKPPANLPLQPYGEQYDDYVRLLYVAATRAKQHLIISSFVQDEQGKAVLASPLVSSVLAAQNATEATASSSVTVAQSVLESALSWPRLDSQDEKALLQPRLTDCSLTQTGLLQFLNIADYGPHYFLEHQLLRLPETPSVAMAYGTAMHAALQAAQQLVNSDSFTMPAIFERFAQALHDQYVPLHEYERFLKHGQQILNQLFMEKAFEFYPGGQAEVSLSDVFIGEARLTGKLDHILTTGNQLLISDYKTGKPLGSFATRDHTKQIKAWQHRTQLLFYILLVKHSGRFPQATNLTAQMTYVEAEQLRDLVLPLTPDPAELERLERLIQAVWRRVLALDFPDVSQYSRDSAGILAFENALLADK